MKYVYFTIIKESIAAFTNFFPCMSAVWEANKQTDFEQLSHMSKVLPI